MPTFEKLSKSSSTLHHGLGHFGITSPSSQRRIIFVLDKVQTVLSSEFQGFHPPRPWKADQAATLLTMIDEMVFDLIQDQVPRLLQDEQTLLDVTARVLGLM